MYTGVATIIKSELVDKGFKAKELGSGVFVWLNRPINTSEVETALDEALGIQFELSRHGKGVMVNEAK